MSTFQKCSQFTWKSRSPRWEGGLPSRLPEHSVHPRVAHIIGRIYELQVFGVLTACLKMLCVYIYIIHIIHIELVHIKYVIMLYIQACLYIVCYTRTQHKTFVSDKKKQHQKRTPLLWNRVPGASHFSRWFWTRILKSDPTIPIPWE